MQNHKTKKFDIRIKSIGLECRCQKAVSGSKKRLLKAKKTKKK